VKRAILEPESGVLMARRAVEAVTEDAGRRGVTYHRAQIARPAGSTKLQQVTTSTSENIVAGEFVFACGPWLGKIFPDLLGGRIFPTRQEVFFFGIPAGETRFAPPALPTWLFQKDEVYGMPDIESRGLKIAFDRHGERIDPDTQSRFTTSEMAEEARSYVAKRFPALGEAPIVQSNVCQYENTSNGDFLIDRHPEMENVWFAGGGSGHGFKHGPAVGEYLAGLIFGEARAESRFSIASKEGIQKRAVY
jgi:sarcosine oxidase